MCQRWKKMNEFHWCTLCYILCFQQNKLLVCSYGERIYKGNTFVMYIYLKSNEYEGNLKFYIWGCFPLEAQRSKSFAIWMLLCYSYMYLYSSYNIVGADEMEFSFSLKWFCGISDFFFIAHSIIVLCSMACIVSKIPEGIIQRIIDVLMNVIIRSFIILLLCSVWLH